MKKGLGLKPRPFFIIGTGCYNSNPGEYDINSQAFFLLITTDTGKIWEELNLVIGG
jgi:hypothetical protein